MEAPGPSMLLALAPPEQPLDGQDAMCERCQHVSLVEQPFLFGAMEPSGRRFLVVEYRVALYCLDGCRPTWRR